MTLPPRADDRVPTRVAEVWSSLVPVTDPELDESVVELGFVTSVEVTGANVSVGFHLPTYWCAANFAYLMAYDLHRSVTALAWTKTVTVTLADHMYADTINRGIAAGQSFSDTFGDEADGELVALRQRFRRKAFQQRQELLLRDLLAHGHSPEDVAAMTMSDLGTLQFGSEHRQHLLARYRDIRGELGGDASALRPAMVSVDGEALTAAGLQAYLASLRRVRLNTQFNGEMCRGLLAARYGATPPTSVEVRVPVPSLSSRPPTLDTSAATTAGSNVNP